MSEYQVPKAGKPFVPMFKKAATKYNVPWQLLARVAQQESAFNPTAKSPVGAQGLMQFMPATAKEYKVNVNDPESSIDGAAKYLSRLKESHGSWDMALAAYNWGTGNLKRKGFDKAPKETRDYVKNIMGDVGKEVQVPVKKPRVNKGDSNMLDGIMAALSGADTALKANPEKYAIVGDMIGQNIAPGNAFAGVGSALGKSSLAGKEVERQNQQIVDYIKALSGKDQPGPSDLKIVHDGKGLKFSSSGNLLGMDGKPAMDMGSLLNPPSEAGFNLPQFGFQNGGEDKAKIADGLLSQLGLKPIL